MNNMDYSVLMSVYAKEKPEYLRQSMQSMFDQTVPTNDFVLVCDGSLTDELDKVIYGFKKLYPKILGIIRIKENKGLGIALNVGLRFCKNELVARMDSDDISRKDRCEKQLAIFENEPDIDIVSGTVEEFVDTPRNIIAKRVLPEYHKDIVNFAKFRSPFNHPCVMFKKSAVMAAGGYRDLKYCEDYYLWVRMIINGARGYNISEPILRMRSGDDMYKRRGGKIYASNQKKLLRYMYKSRFIIFSEYIINYTVRMVSCFIPSGSRKTIYQKFLRR